MAKYLGVELDPIDDGGMTPEKEVRSQSGLNYNGIQLDPISPVDPQAEVEASSSSNPLTNLAKGLYKGTVYGLPRLASQSAEFLGIGGDTAKQVSEWAKKGLEGQPGIMEQAGEMIPESVGVPLGMMTAGKAISLVPHPAAKAVGLGLQLLGKYATPALFGLSQAQTTKETAEKAGVEPGIIPYVTGGIEWAGETLANIALGKIFGPLGQLSTEALKQTTATQALKGTIGGYIKQMALTVLPTEISTEMGQNFFEAMAEQKSGIRPDAQPMQEAISAIGPTAVMSLLLGGAGGLARSYVANRQSEVLSSPVDINQPNATEAIKLRSDVANYLSEEIADPNLKKQWMDYANARILANQPIDVNVPLDSLSLAIETQMSDLQGENAAVREGVGIPKAEEEEDRRASQSAQPSQSTPETAEEPHVKIFNDVLSGNPPNTGDAQLDAIISAAVTNNEIEHPDDIMGIVNDYNAGLYEEEKKTTASPSVVAQAPAISTPEVTKTGNVTPVTQNVTPAVSGAPVPGYAVQDVPVSSIKISKDVPQFKKEANEKGVVEPLQGEEYRRFPANPIVLWERKNGDLEVITGRHRFDLAQRLGEQTIPAQIIKESDGFTADQAMIFDAEQNILDNQGSDYDYALYFRKSGLPEADAKRRGLLRGDKAKAAFVLGKDAADTTFDAFRRQDIDFKQAVAIAKSAPNDDALQNAGLHILNEDPKLSAEELTQAMSLLKDVKPTKPSGPEQMDMFGYDDSVIKQVISQGKTAAKIMARIKKDATAIRTAMKGEKLTLTPEAMADYGITDSKDKNQLTSALNKILKRQAEWETWKTNPELQEQVRLEMEGKKENTPPLSVPITISKITKDAYKEFGNTSDLDKMLLNVTNAWKQVSKERPDIAKKITKITIIRRDPAAAVYGGDSSIGKNGDIEIDPAHALSESIETLRHEFEHLANNLNKSVESEEKSRKAEKGGANEIKATEPTGTQAINQPEEGSAEESKGVVSGPVKRSPAGRKVKQPEPKIETEKSQFDKGKEEIAKHSEKTIESQNEVRTKKADYSAEDDQLASIKTTEDLNKASNIFSPNDKVIIPGGLRGIIKDISNNIARVHVSNTPDKAFSSLPISVLRHDDGSSEMLAELNQAIGDINEFGQKAGKLDANMARTLQMMGRNQYGESIGQITLKELIQNCFDTVKERVYKGHYKVGNIKIIIDSRERTIEFTDDGMGMTEETVDKAFFTLGGTKKDMPVELRSGGLGLAKVAVFTCAERVYLNTVKDGKRCVVDSLATKILANDFIIDRKPAPKSEHGTTVKVWIPANTKNDDGTTTEIAFPRGPESWLWQYGFMGKPLIGPAKITCKYDDNDEQTLPMGINQDMSATPKLTTVRFKTNNFEWGYADIYFGTERKDRNNTNHYVLSSGIYQFTHQFNIKPYESIPYDIIVDIHSKVDAEHSSYPFTNNREAFKPAVKDDDIAALQTYLAKIARGESAKALKASFKDIISLPRIDVGNESREDMEKYIQEQAKAAIDSFNKRNLTPEQMADLDREIAKERETVRAPEIEIDKNNGINAIVKNKVREIISKDEMQAEKRRNTSFSSDLPAPAMEDFMVELGKTPDKPIFHNNTNVDWTKLGVNPQLFFSELGSVLTEMKEDLAKTDIWQMDTMRDMFYTGIAIDKEYSGLWLAVPYKAVFVNPLNYVGGVPKTIFGLRNYWYKAMIHEFAHNQASNHDVAHDQAEFQINTYLEDNGLADYYRNSLLRIAATHLDTLEILRREYDKSTTRNITRGLKEYEGKRLAAGRSDMVPEEQTGTLSSRQELANGGSLPGRDRSGGKVEVPGGPGENIEGNAGEGAGQGNLTYETAQAPVNPLLAPPVSKEVIDLANTLRSIPEATPRQIIDSYESATGQSFPYKFLLPILAKTGVKFSSNLSNLFSKPGIRVKGQFDGDKNIIYMATPDTDAFTSGADRLESWARTFAHESIHAIIHNLKSTNRGAYDKFLQRMGEFWNIIQTQEAIPDNINRWRNELDRIYAKNEEWKKLEEVLTYGMTNKNFASWLNSIPSTYGASGKSGTLWQKFKEIILKALSTVGIGRTKLDELSDIMDDVFDMPISDRDVAKAMQKPVEQGSLFEFIPPATDAFKKWFGDSKVVDENGKPLVVYHWTDYEFNEFDTEGTGGSHFGTKQAAWDRANGQEGISYDIDEDEDGFWVYADSGPNSGDGRGPFPTKKEAQSFIKTQPKRIEPMAVYLSIQKPLRLHDSGIWNFGSIHNQLTQKGVLSEKDSDKIWTAWKESDSAGWAALKETLLENGIDGFVYKNEQEDKGSDSYVVLSPTQIKSATANVGTYDANNPDIRYSAPDVGPIALPPLPNALQRMIGTLTSNFTSNPQRFSLAMDKTIGAQMKSLNADTLKWYDRAFSTPFHMAQKYNEWKLIWMVHGIERVEQRGDLRNKHIKVAEPYFNLNNILKAKGLNHKQRQEAKARVIRMIFATDAMLHDELVALKSQIQGTEGITRNKLQNRINEIRQLRRYSDEQLTNGITDEYGNTIKLNSPEEISAYISVRKAMDEMMSAKIAWLHAMAFEKYRTQKWYNLLMTAAGVDISEPTVQTILGKKGLDAAVTNAIKSIKPDIDNIFDRIESGIKEIPDNEVNDASDRFRKVANKLQKELAKFETYVGKITGITNKQLLTDVTRDIFAAYMQTRPYLRRIKTLRNQMNDWVGYFPRYREQGKFKARLVEHVYDQNGNVTDNEIHSEMFDNRLGLGKIYSNILSKYGKDGVLPENYEILTEPISVSPESAFQGVSDVNVQKIIDDAISNMKLQATTYDRDGNKVDLSEALREAAFQSIANQFMMRGAGRSSIHRKTELIKGYEEENLDRVFLNYISSMTGIMTKQMAAAKAINILKDIKNPAMFEAISKYNREMLRNQSVGDRFSGRLRSLMFIWYLGGLLRPAIVNLTQNPIVGFPELARYMRANKIGGAGKADLQYAGAMKDVFLGRLSTEENKLVDEMVSKGIAQDLFIQSIFEGMDNKIGQAYSTVARWMATPFSLMEVYNRKSAAVALFRSAYPMYQKQGLSDAEAYNKAFEDARTFIDNVHYVYGKTNYPLLMQSGEMTSTALKTLYTFRGFTHNFLIRQATLMGAKDFRTLMHTMAYLAIFGGLMALPFFKDFFDWIEKKYGFSPNAYVRKSLRGIGGETLESIGMNGLPSVLGINISGSLAVGLPWPIGSETPEDTIFGVYGGMIQKAKRGIEAASVGDVSRTIQELSPEMIGSATRAIRESNLGSPGFATTSRGRAIYGSTGEPITMSTREAITKALGFSPVENAREKEMNRTIKRQESWYLSQVQDAGARYRTAKLSKDPDALRNLVKDVREINAGIKARGIQKLVPRASVSRILKSSRPAKTIKQRREMGYKESVL